MEAETFCRRVWRKQVEDLGRSGLQRAMNSRIRGCILSLGSEDLWGAKRSRDRLGRCESSSFRKPSWAGHLSPHCNPQPSDVGSSLFASCLSTSNTHQTSSSRVYLLSNCFYVNRTQPAPPRLCRAVFPFWGELVALRPTLSGHPLLVLLSHGGGAQSASGRVSRPHGKSG